MPFQKGHKLAKGGRREGAGRKRKEQIELERTAQEMAVSILERNAGRIMGTYVELAASGQDSATTRHAVDRLIPSDVNLGQGQIINVTIGQLIKAPSAEPGSQVWGNGIQIHLGRSDGENGNGSDGA